MSTKRLMPISNCNQCSEFAHYGFIFKTHYCKYTGMILEQNKEHYATRNEYPFPSSCPLEVY